jgi:WhiB family redox-sensing transcriptional regulator
MCPVVDKCLQYALENREQHGIWGGLTVGERQALLRKFKIPRKK